MPNIIHGEVQGDSSILRDKTFNYDYPNGLDLRPTSKLHNDIKNKILERARTAANHISSRFESWRAQDQFLTAYKRSDDEENKVTLTDDRKPVSIVFPYSYAILETLLSYMISAFFREPIFRYEGYSPDDVMGSILMEQAINLHCNKHKVMLNLHTMFRDSFTYGIGVVAPYWKTGRSFSGNALRNIDPYLYLPDPNVSADKIQDGEFVGWINETNYFSLLQEESTNTDMFNVQYLKGLIPGKTTIRSGDNTSRNIKTGSTKSTTGGVNPIDEIPMYITIIPQEWGLGNSTYPEKWLFKLAADQVIITARPADFNHDKYPLSVCCPDYDGYSATPLSRLEILGGLQGVLDWLFNSHIANVRKAINDMIIYDPYAINSNDLKDPKPGKLIRARRPIWGKGGIDQYIKQLGVTDITRANMGDSTFIVQWMQKIGATDDAAMGSLRSGGPERLTSAEFKGTANGAISRLERIAKIIGLQSMQDIGEFFADHTIQMMDEEMYIKVSGDWQPLLLDQYSDSIDRGRMRVSPSDLDINYDVLVRDGSIPGGNQSNFMAQAFEMIANHPELAQTFDIVKIFKSMARNAGEKNVNEFIRRGGNMQAKTMPNEQIEQQVQQGNLIPFQGGA